MRILDNGLDSFKKALNKLNNLDSISPNEYEYALKDIVINFHHSLETLFKHLVMNKSNYLVYESSSKAFKKEVDQKLGKRIKDNLNTIQFIDALNGVIALYDVDIDKIKYNKIKALNNYRNSLTHFEYDFTKHEIEHLIALVLPVAIEILKNIDCFNNFMTENNLESNTLPLLIDTDIWALERLRVLEKKYIDAANIFDDIKEDNPQEISKFYDNRDNSFIYNECPSCENKSFIRLGSLIEGGSHVGYYGHCKLCEINIEKSDAQFLSMFTNEKSEFLKNARKLEYELLKSVFNEKINLNNISINRINVLRDIYSKFQTSVDRLFKNRINNRLNDIRNKIGDYYFEKYINGDSEFGDRLIYNQSLKVDCYDYDYIDYIKSSGAIEFVLDKINVAISFFEKISNKSVNKISNDFTKKSYVYKTLYWPNPHMDNEEKEGEVEIKVHFGYDALK